LQKKQATQAYYATISFMDAQVGRLLNALQESGLAEETIVIFMSDHGFHLGQHDLWQKQDLFEGSVRAPLIISVPGSRVTGVQSKALVEYLDLYPTLTELLEIEKPDWLQGRSLLPVLNGNSSQVRQDSLSMTYSAAHRTRPELTGRRVIGYTLRTDRYRYTEWDEGREGVELYDYQDDPMEFTNLAGKPEVESLQESLKDRLAARRESARTAVVISP
jgi:arylsulfatase A-like enzyme